MTDQTYIFLHGGGQGSWVWEETIAALTAQSPTQIRTLALDIPGCGTKRGQTSSHLSFDDIITALITDIETSGLTSITLIGHSQAGQIIPFLLARRPALFRRVIYLSCSIPLPGQTVIAMIGNGVHGQNPTQVGWPLDPATHSMEQRFTAMFCNDMTEQQATTFFSRLGGDAWPASSYSNTNWPTAHLGQIPASFIICLRDNILPVSWQEIFAARFHAQTLHRLDAGHQAMTTQPQALATILREEC